MKFRYYLFYKNYHYILLDRKTNKEHTEITFKSMYDYINYKHIQYIDIKIKSMTMFEFFRDYVTFEDKSTRI